MRSRTISFCGLAAFLMPLHAIAGPCEEEADVIAIVGETAVPVSADAVLTVLASGIDPGGTPFYAWQIVSGAGSFVGPTDGPSVQITSSVSGNVVVVLTYDDGTCIERGAVSDELTIDFLHSDGFLKPGDMNLDGLFNLSDPIALLNHLFGGGESPPPPCGDGTTTHAANVMLFDLNGNGSVDLSDPIYAINFLFSGGPKPVNCTDFTCPCVLGKDCPVTLGGDCQF